MSWETKNQEIGANIVLEISKCINDSPLRVLILEEVKSEVNITMTVNGLSFKIVDEPNPKLTLYRICKNDDVSVDTTFGEWIINDLDEITKYCFLAMSQAIFIHNGMEQMNG